jgi:hypothetical protein
VRKLNRARAVVSAIVALTIGMLAMPAMSSAGTLDWDYKVAAQIFRHPIDVANTTYNQSANTGVVAYKGSVRSLNEAHYVDIEFEDPRVDATNDLLTAVVNYRPASWSPPGWSTPTTLGRVAIADLPGLSGYRSTSGATTTWSGVVPELTATGASVFAGGYLAGEPFGELELETP